MLDIMWLKWVRTHTYEGVSKIFVSHNEYSLTFGITLLRSNTKGYGGKTHQTDSQNSNTTAPSGTELYHLQFSLQAASPETFGYTHTFCIYTCGNKSAITYNMETVKCKSWGFYW
jgi:hypothetical protein